MESKQAIQALTTLSNNMDKLKSDIEAIKIELARNERVTKLETQMAGMEVKMWVLFGVIAMIASAFIGFYFQHK